MDSIARSEFENFYSIIGAHCIEEFISDLQINIRNVYSTVTESRTNIYLCILFTKNNAPKRFNSFQRSMG